jgi:hypothetical protein
MIAQRPKECWINVYLLPDGTVKQGYCYFFKLEQISSIYEILYRIHVRLK